MKKRFISILLVLCMMATMLPTTAYATRPTKTQGDALNWARAQVGQVLGSGQCVDLIMNYYRFLGRSPAVLNGCDYAKSQALRFGWSQVYQAQPQPGDILVYEGGPLNPYGHVAIYESDYVHYHQNVIGEPPGVVRGTWHYKDFDTDYLSYWGVVRPAWPSASDPSDNEYGYRITLDANGGTVTPDHIFADYTYGENGALPIPTKPGYSFYCWNTDKTATISSASISNTVSSTHVITRTYDHTLYAVWQPLKYTVSFDAAGGTASQSSRNISYGSTYDSLPTATRNGYRFLGWFTSASGGTEITSSDTYSVAGDQTLYAHWEQAIAAHMHSLAHTMAKAATQTAEGNIEYWYCSECGKYFSDSAASIQITKAQTVISKLPATEVEMYTIKFNANGGTVSESQRTVPWGENIGELPIPVRTGYRFLGWYILPTTSSAKVTSDTSVNSVNLPDGCTLYAQWRQEDATHTHSLIHTTAMTATQTAEGNIEYWYCSGCDKYYSDSAAATQITKTQTVIPKLTAASTETYTITFDPNGGGTSQTGKKILYGSTYDSLPTAARSGYNFLGWFTSASGGSKVTSGDTYSIAGDQTLYAHWEQAIASNSKVPMSDVPTNAYYFDAVQWAIEQKITSGTTSTTFSPNAPCTLAHRLYPSCGALLVPQR